MPDAPPEFLAPWNHVVNRVTGRYLAVSAGNRNAGEVLIEWGDRTGADQQWEFDFNDKLLARVRNRNSGLRMGIRAGYPAPGTQAIQWPTEGYYWRLEHIAGKVVRIVFEPNGQCLDVEASQQVVQSIRGSSETQFWIIEPDR